MSEEAKTLSTKDLVRRLEEVEKKLAKREIDAETIVVRRPGEKKSVILTVANGAPQLMLLDDKGEPRASLTLTQRGTALLSLSGGNGKPAVDLQARPNGNTAVTVRDAAGSGRLVLAVESDGSAVVGILDKKGNPSAALSSLANEAPNVIVFPQGEAPVMLRESANEKERHRLLDLLLRHAKTEGVH